MGLPTIADLVMTLEAQTANLQRSVESGAGVPDRSGIDRCADALERIAAALERFEPDDEPCAHPPSEIEVSPEATMGNIVHRCKACGKEGMLVNGRFDS